MSSRDPTPCSRGYTAKIIGMVGPATVYNDVVITGGSSELLPDRPDGVERYSVTLTSGVILELPRHHLEVIMDIDFIDEDGWQAVQLRAENGKKAQDCTTLNDRSNVRSIVDSLCRQLATLVVKMKLNTIGELFKFMDENGDGYVCKNEFYNLCQKLELRFPPSAINLVRVFAQFSVQNLCP
jgi:hypothetical protein